MHGGILIEFAINGFVSSPEAAQSASLSPEATPAASAPRKSVVQVRFPGWDKGLAYYNDQFDLKAGDRVYVDGKLEGQIGVVTAVNYSFKIKLSEYKRIIALVDTDVHGKFYMVGSLFVTFDSNVLPPAQATLWFRAPDSEEEVYVSGDDNFSFPLDDLQEMVIGSAIAERGHQYYMKNRVQYLCLNSIKGYAIVQGSHAYTVEFEYQCGSISKLVCDCFCSYPCKHEFAAILQLRETLGLIQKRYAEEYAQTGCLTAIYKETLFAFAVSGKEYGSFTL